MSSFYRRKSPNLPIWSPKPSVILSQVSLQPQPWLWFPGAPAMPDHLPLLSPRIWKFVCNASVSQTHLKCHFLQDACLIFDLCKELLFPSFVLWRHRGDHFSSLSWHLYICFHLCSIKAAFSPTGLQTTLAENSIAITSSMPFNLDTH